MASPLRRIHRKSSSNPPPSRSKIAKSAAARLNASILKKLQRALEEDPECNLASLLPASYATRLRSRIDAGQRAPPKQAEFVTPSKDEDIQSESKPSTVPFVPAEELDVANVLYPVSSLVLHLAESLRTPGDAPDMSWMTDDICNILAQSTIIWQSETNPQRFVAQCSTQLVVKCVSSDKDHTEYTSLMYLERHAPDLCVPRAHGLVACGKVTFIFMSYIPGTTLDAVWDRLLPSARQQICHELEAFFERLGGIHKPADLPFGGVGEEGCKDTRRHTRISEGVIENTRDFYEFLYGKALLQGNVYRQLLHGIALELEADQEACVFTHGDMHIGNVMVAANEEMSACSLAGIVDWEMSGFYPSSFESIKLTNTLATNETSDWFLSIPPSIAPTRRPARWLLDKTYDPYVA